VSPDNAPIELKVKTGTAAALCSAFILSLLSSYVFHGVVPDFVNDGIVAIVTGGIGFGVMWLTKHTPRGVIDVESDNTSQLPPQVTNNPGNTTTGGPVTISPVTDPPAPNAP